MNRSSELDQIAEALSKAQAEFPTIAKTEEGKVKGTSAKGDYEYSYKYADLAEVVEKTRPILAAHGLAVSQLPGYCDKGPTLETIVLHESGQFIASEMLTLTVQQTPQGQGSGITYARRYAYCAALNIVADEDDDGSVASRQSAGDAFENAKPSKPPEDPDGRPAVLRRMKALGDEQRDVLGAFLEDQGIPKAPGKMTDEQLAMVLPELRALEGVEP